MRKEARTSTTIMQNGQHEIKPPVVPTHRTLVSADPAVWLETITPELAAAWLATQAQNNRRLSEFVVTRYVSDMASGMWELSEAAICFNQRGELVNGQHRLNAIIQSGKAVRAVVLIGLSETAIRRMDIGRQRNFAQIMSMQGISSATRRSSVARTIALLANSANRDRITAPFLEAVYKRNEAAINAAFDVLHGSGHNKIASGGIIGACAFAYPADNDGVWLFMQNLATGANLRNDDPALSFRRYLDGRHAPSKPEQIAPLALYAIHKALRGEACEKFSTPRSYGFLTQFRTHHPAEYTA